MKGALLHTSRQNWSTNRDHIIYIFFRTFKIVISISPQPLTPRLTLSIEVVVTPAVVCWC